MEFKSYTRSEIAADAVVHVLGVAFALIGGPILIGMVAAGSDGWTIAAISVYVATLIAMFSCSAGYNLAPVSIAKEWLRRLDHSTIYLKIAGAYTPFAMISMSGGVGKMLLLMVWLAAAIGIGLKLVYPRRFEILSLALYLAMGWAAIVVADEVAASVDGATMILLLVSGGLYTFGVVFHVWEKLPFQNAIWHVFVLAATAVLSGARGVVFVCGAAARGAPRQSRRGARRPKGAPGRSVRDVSILGKMKASPAAFRQRLAAREDA